MSNTDLELTRLITLTKDNILEYLDSNDVLIPSLAEKKQTINIELCNQLYNFCIELNEKVYFNQRKDVNKKGKDAEQSEQDLRDELRKQLDLNRYYAETVRSQKEMMRKTEVQMNFLKGKLTRREDELDNQRLKFYKEISILNEMVYKKENDIPVNNDSRVSFENWKAEAESVGQRSTKDVDLIEEEFVPMHEFKKYKNRLQTLNKAHKEEMELVKKEYQEEKEKFEQDLEDQKLYYEKNNKKIAESEKERNELRFRVDELETEKVSLELRIKDLERKISDLQDMEVQWQGQLSEKLELIQSLYSKLEEAKKDSSTVIHRGAKLTIEEAKKKLSEYYTQSLEWMSAKEKHQTEIQQLHQIRQELQEKLKNEIKLTDKLQKQNEELKNNTSNLDTVKEISTKILEMEARYQKLNAKYEYELEVKQGVDNAEILNKIEELQDEIASLQDALSLKNRNEIELKRYIKQLETQNRSKSNVSAKKRHSAPNSAEMDIIEHMDVFRRLQHRHAQLSEKKSNQRREVLLERKVNLELVLDSVGNINKQQGFHSARQQNEKRTSNHAHYWNDLKEVIQEEIANRQKLSEKNRAAVENLLGPSSLAKLSAESMQKELNHLMKSKNNAFVTSKPLSPRPLSPRPMSAREPLTRKTAPVSFHSYTDSRFDYQPMPRIPKLYTKLVEKPDPPSYQSFRKPVPPNPSANRMRPATARARSKKSKEKSGSLSARPNVRKYRPKSASASSKKKKTIIPSSGLPIGAKPPEKSYEDTLRSRNLNTDIIEKSSKIFKDSKDRKRIIWEMQFKEEKEGNKGHQVMRA